MIKNLLFRSLKRYTFVDIEDLEVGSIEDLLLDPITLAPTHLLLGAGFFEEYMETVGKRPDIDELAELEILQEVDDNVILINKKISDLITTSNEGKIPFNTILFSSLDNSPVKLRGNKEAADLQDFEINSEDSSFIFHFSGLMEKLALVGYRQRIDIKVPIKMVKIVNNEIDIAYSMDELLEKIKGNLEPRMNGKSVFMIS